MLGFRIDLILQPSDRKVLLSHKITTALFELKMQHSLHSSLGTRLPDLGLHELYEYKFLIVISAILRIWQCVHIYQPSWHKATALELQTMEKKSLAHFYLL